MNRTVFIFLILTFLQAAQAAPTCAGLFTADKYKLYDPVKIEQQHDALLRGGQLEILKMANARKTHLPFFEDFVLETVDRLVRHKNVRSPELSAAIDKLGVEAFTVLAQEKLTYEWVMEFSFRARSIFSGNPIPMFVNLDKRVRSFPNDIMIPTYARQDFKHFIEIEGKYFTFTAMRELDETVDGAPRPLNPEQNDHHDFQHYFLTQKSDVVLDPKHRYHELWLSIHNKIREKIEQLSKPEKRYTEFVYFYFLHEEFGLRTRLVKAFVDKQRLSPSELAAILLNYQLIKDNDPSMIMRAEIYRRTANPLDFKSAFPEKTNPQEILLVGIGNFIQILKEIESDPAL